MIAALQGVFSGLVLGLCVAPLWMVLKLPMRISDILDAGSMTFCAVALTLGAMLGCLTGVLSLPLSPVPGIAGLLLGGIFTGMLASALTEVLNVIPVLFDRLSITSDMRLAAWALCLGKMIGALIAGLMEV